MVGGGGRWLSLQEPISKEWALFGQCCYE
jgi:hypothetical protein